MAERPYSRVYWSIIDDPKFAEVYDNDAHLAAWLRLLMIADQAYPASAHIPTNVQRDSVNFLASVGLIETAGFRYRVHGLASEREMRSQYGRNAAAKRWHSEGNARQDETRQATDETSSPLPLTRGRRKDGTNPRQTGDNPRANGTSPRQEREAQKRGPSALHEILSSIQTGGKP